MVGITGTALRSPSLVSAMSLWKLQTSLATPEAGSDEWLTPVHFRPESASWLLFCGSGSLGL